VLSTLKEERKNDTRQEAWRKLIQEIDDGGKERERERERDREEKKEKEEEKEKYEGRKEGRR
jgi:hypothetical protein